MQWLITKYLISAGIVVLISEVAKRSGKLGAFMAALPLITLLSMVWLHVEQAPETKIAEQAWYTFWYVLPSLPMFLLCPWLWRHGVNFHFGLLIGCVVTVALYLATRLLLTRFGVAI